MQVRRHFPPFAAVLGTKEVTVTVGRLRVPRCDVDVPGVRRINDNVVENHLRGRAQKGPPRPTGATVAGKIESAGAGAEKNAVGILGIKSQTTDTAALGAQRLPLLRPPWPGREK